MATFGIKHRLTTAYHPQANGLDERFNQTLSNTIAKFAQEERCSWDEKLPEIVYSYNTAVQESSRHTPFEAMFGRQAKLPVDFNTEKEFDPDVKLEKELNSHSPSKDVISTNHKRIEESVKRNVERSRKSKRNTTTRSMVLAVATQWVRLFTRRIFCAKRDAPMPPLKPAYMDTPSNSPNLGAKNLMLQYKQSKVSSHPKISVVNGQTAEKTRSKF